MFVFTFCKIKSCRKICSPASVYIIFSYSCKRFIGQITGKENPADRVFGTAATTALAASAGVSIVRVHDIAPTADVIKVVNSIKNAVA